MNSMFKASSTFNQNISTWDVSGVTSYTDFNKDSSLNQINSPFDYIFNTYNDLSGAVRLWDSSKNAAYLFQV